jgi:hypothetical protein
MENFLEDVDHLIKDTDGAFKAVTKSWYDTTPTLDLIPPKVNPKVLPLLVIQRMPTIPRGATRRAPRASTNYTRMIASGPQNKRKTTIKKKTQPNVLNRVTRSGLPSSNQSPSKWKLLNVTANMVDALSVKGLGKRFRAIEADEMLTPGRLQQIRQGALLEDRARNSTESSRSRDTATSNTPTEPFHLEDLSSRLDAAILHESSSALEAMHITQNIPSRKHGTMSEFALDDIPQEPLLNEGVRFPTRLSPKHNSLVALPFDDDPHDHTNSKSLLLPAIPHISPFKFPLTQCLLGSSSTTPDLSTDIASLHNHLIKATPLPQKDDRNIYLPSTLYTQVAPLFLQGAIRISSKSLESQRVEQKYSSLHAIWEETEQLDWIAFQLAMIGNSLPQTNKEDDDDEDDENRTDIMMWWEGFAIGPPGSLIKEGVGHDLDVESPASSVIFKPEEMFEADIDDDAEELSEDYLLHFQPLAISLSRPHLVHGNSLLRRKPLPFDLSRPSKTAELDSTSTSVKSSAPETPASLPSSPMFALLGSDGESMVEVTEEPKIPMGFNLSHDLGDFLEWEMRYVPLEEDLMGEDIYGA